MTTPLEIGDRVRIAAEPKVQPLIVMLLYLEGSEEVLTAGLAWKKGAQLVFYPASDLVREP
jgi:trehalose utilization protein